MSIRVTSTSTGKKRYIETISYYDKDGKRVQKKITGKTKSECKEKSDEFKKSLLLRKDEVSFKQLYSLFLKDCDERNLKSNTINTKRNVIEKYLLSYFGDTNVSDIDRKMISELYKEISERSFEETGDDLSESYKRSIKTQLSCLLNFGVRCGFIENNYNKGIIFGSKTSKLYEIWTNEEFHKFISGLDNDLMYKTIFILLWTTGMRIGELLGLRYSDFDFSNNTVSILRNYQDGKLQSLKTSNSKREIKVSNITLNYVKDYYEKSRYINNKNRLFSIEMGNVEGMKKRVCLKTGVKSIRLHDIRHSFITLNIDRGVNINTVSQMVGHKSVTTTLDNYYHCKKQNQIQISDFYDLDLKDL